MSIITSPIFVIAFLSSPLWLGLIAYLCRDNSSLSRILWSYASLILFVDLALFNVDSQIIFWTSLFSLKGLFLLASSVISVVTLERHADKDASLLGYIFAFLVLSCLAFAALLVIPGIISDFFKLLANTYHNLIQFP